MNLEISYEPQDEEITMVLDDSTVLKAELGSREELVLNDAFKELQEDNEALYLFLRSTVRGLFKLTDV